MSFIVMYDACVLYPNTVRDLLIRIHQVGLVQAKWTEKILDEMSEALTRTKPGIDLEKTQKLRKLMVSAVRDRFVTDDPRGFPADHLAGWDIDVKTADEFVLDQISLDQQKVYGALVRIADSRNDPPQSVSDVPRELAQSGLIESVAALSSG